MLEVAHLADRRVALDVHLANLAGRQLDLSVRRLPRHQLRSGTGGTDHLAALAALELDVVDHRAERNAAAAAASCRG